MAKKIIYLITLKDIFMQFKKVKKQDTARQSFRMGLSYYIKLVEVRLSAYASKNEVFHEHGI
ncbi:hypothetical protein D3C73_1619180 [compost metagenome]